MAGRIETVDARINHDRTGLLTGRRGRILKENLTAYLFLFPAMSLIFVFGVFPVAFSLYVSMYKWKIKQGAFRGFANYTKAMDNLAYVVAFLLVIGAVWGAIALLIKVWKFSREAHESPWLFIVPGAVFTGAVYYLIKYVVLLLPEILAIGSKVQRVQKTRELYVKLFKAAFDAEAVVRAQWHLLLWVGTGIVLWLVLNQFVRTRHNGQYLGRFFLMTLAGTAAWQIGQFTYISIQTEYAAALEKGKEIAIWPQAIAVLSGLLLLYFSWRLWQYAIKLDSSPKMVLGLFAAVVLLVGAWILAGELPPIIAAGDEALWEGLLTTAWYSLGTVPLQLAAGLAIAYLLYQEIKAKSFFRMIYFLPYVTPAVASASVFRIMFSNRPTGMMNNVLRVFGAEPLKWLLEPRSIFTIFGVQGPSLALVVIILFGIWTYSGYNAVIFLAGLGGIPQSLYEAAQIDGANRWQSFRHITLPLLSPITYFLSLLGVIGTFKAFNHVFVLRSAAALRTVDTMSMVIWDLIKTDTRYGYGTAMAFVLFGVVLILTLINNSIQGKRVFYG